MTAIRPPLRSFEAKAVYPIRFFFGFFKKPNCFITLPRETSNQQFSFWRPRPFLQKRRIGELSANGAGLRAEKKDLASHEEQTRILTPPTPHSSRTASNRMRRNASRQSPSSYCQKQKPCRGKHDESLPPGRHTSPKARLQIIGTTLGFLPTIQASAPPPDSLHAFKYDKQYSENRDGAFCGFADVSCALASRFRKLFITSPTSGEFKLRPDCAFFHNSFSACLPGDPSQKPQSLVVAPD